MAISRSSALKIKTSTWITFSITIPPKQNPLAGTLAVLLLYHCVNLLSALAYMLGSLEKRVALKLERQKNGNSSRAQKQGGPQLIIHQSNVTTQRTNDNISGPMPRLKDNGQKSLQLRSTNP